MDELELNEYQKIILDSVKKVAKEKILPISKEIDERGEFSWEIARLFADLGLLQIFLPPEYGGMERDKCLMFSLIVEEIAKACASSALLIVIQAVGSFPIIDSGSRELKEALFPRLATGRELIAYLVTEPGAGSDVASICTTAIKKEGFYLLNGRKSFATNGGVASLASVLA